MKRLVLVGAGHAHALVLKELAQSGRQARANLEVVLVSPVVQAPYSGMIPGWLAGYYRWEECCIDFVRLCRRAGAEVRIASVTGLDPDRQELTLNDGTRLRFDWLSLNIGSTLTPPSGDGPMILPTRPLDQLRQHWENLQSKLALHKPGKPFRLLTIGGGAAGVESVLAASHSLQRIAPETRFSFTLAMDGRDILPGMASGAARRLRQHLAKRRIEIVSHFLATQVSPEGIVGQGGRVLPADAVLWATGARPHDWLRKCGLELDENGFVRIDAALRSTSHDRIFAAGDCAGWKPPLPKAGVFSVRMGPVLAHNVLAAVRGQALHAYVPQRRYLALLGTGDENAVAAWGGYSWQGSWMWRWKQVIDRRFVKDLSQE